MDDNQNTTQDDTNKDAVAAENSVPEVEVKEEANEPAIAGGEEADATAGEAQVSDQQSLPSDEENPFAALKADTEESAETKDEVIAEPEAAETPEEAKEKSSTEESSEEPKTEEAPAEPAKPEPPANPNARWYVVHTFAGHENKVAAALKQRIEAEHLENLIFDILVPTQDKIEIRGGKKETVKEKIFPGYILIKMELNDTSWLAVRTTQGVTSFIGAGNKPTPISEAEVATIVKFTSQGAQPTFKDVFMVDDTVKIVDGPFAEFIGKVDSVDKEKGRVRVLVSIFGRETPVELDFLQVQKL